MPNISEVRERAIKKIREGVPQVVFTVIVAVLIKIFADLVFVPVARNMGAVYGFPLASIVGLIVLVTLIILLLRAMFALIKIADGLADFLSAEVSQLGTIDEKSIGKTRVFFRSIVYAIIIVIIFVLLARYLAVIHPALASVVLLAVVLWIIVLLYKGGAVVSDEIAKTLEKIGKKAKESMEEKR